MIEVVDNKIERSKLQWLKIITTVMGVAATRFS